jgi:hypothetical protein
MPRTAFTGGITKITTLAAHEYSGLALSFALLFHITEVKETIGVRLAAYGINIKAKMYTNMFADMLSFIRWTKEGPFRGGKIESEKIGNGINKFLAKQLRHFPRLEGCGWRLQKTHDITHAYFYMRRYGSLMNFDTGHTERLLKYQAKKLGRNALSWTENIFRKSSSLRAEESLVLQKAAFAAAHQLPIMDDNDFCSFDDDNSIAGRIRRAGFWISTLSIICCPLWCSDIGCNTL